MKNRIQIERRRIIKRPRKKTGSIFVQAEQEADNKSEKHDHHDSHPGGQHLVDSRRGLHPPKVERRESPGIENRERPVRHSRQNVLGQFAAQNRADQRVEDVVHHHCPARQVAQAGMNFLADVGVSGSRARIHARQHPVTDRREQHRHHGDQNGGHHVPARRVIHYAVQPHGSDRLDDHDADDDQVPQRQ